MVWHVRFLPAGRRTQPTAVRASLPALPIAPDPQQLSSGAHDLELKVLVERGFYDVRQKTAG